MTAAATEPETEPFVSTRRAGAPSHLRDAGKAPLASDAERYHLDAATSEALARHLPEIVAELASIAHALGTIATELAREPR